MLRDVPSYLDAFRSHRHHSSDTTTLLISVSQLNRAITFHCSLNLSMQAAQSLLASRPSQLSPPRLAKSSPMTKVTVCIVHTGQLRVRRLDWRAHRHWQLSPCF
ncbi:hypothetical protein PM082_007800 [Marasmius tenuissimus]|nr:hypothetical protein PM082_007800 [Marasmius tenuissimus]